MDVTDEFTDQLVRQLVMHLTVIGGEVELPTSERSPEVLLGKLIYVRNRADMAIEAYFAAKRSKN